MDYLSIAKNIEERALAPGFFSGEAAWLKSRRPFAAVIGFAKWLRGVRFINAAVRAVSAVLIFVQSYAVVLVIASAAATLSAAFLLLALPVFAAAYLTSGKRCRREAKALAGSRRPVCFVFLSKKLSDRPFLRRTLEALSEENEIYVVTGNVSVGVNGGKRRIASGISYVHRVFYHRLKKELERAGYEGRVTVVI